MSAQDPRNTTQRLANALEAIATGTGTADEHIQAAIDAAFYVFVPDDFPDQADKEFLDMIQHHTASSTEKQLTDKEALEGIWNPYWKMSDKNMYFNGPEKS